MEQFWLLRIQFDVFDERKFYQAINELHGSKYNLSATNADAPWVTHCVSAVRYLIQKASGYTLPLMYVGDMCRNILDKWVPSAHIIPLSEWDRWDLVFFLWRSRISHLPAITHVGVLLDGERLFHSTYGRWWVIDPICMRINDGSIATCRILSSYTDERWGSWTFKKNM